VERLTEHLSAAQREAFDTYRERILSERPRAGLTSLTDPDAIERRHFVESLALLEALEEHGVLSSPVIDIGSGAGFPGLPMKIARPDLEMTLLEATGKKAAFLEAVASELGLAGITVIAARAEDLGRDTRHRERYALAVARALAPLRVLLELALPLVTVGGHLAAPKGSGAQREIAEASTALTALGGEIVLAEPLESVTVDVKPTLVLVRKIAPTPERYPRRPGVPSKRPL
jgi:16S rRNA (guanine527-N7)-methyltransferase